MSKPITEVAISAYNSIAKIPQVASGRFLSSPSVASIDFKQRCLPAGEWENFQLTVKFSDKLELIGHPVPLSKSSVFVSPSGNKQISLKTNTTDTKQQFLQYWNANRLEHTVDLKALDLHQQVVEKAPFHAASWSADERYFFYLAEKKVPKTKSFFDQKAASGADVVPGNEYKYQEDWGEQLTGISKTVVGVFDSNALTTQVMLFDGGEDKCITKLQANPTNEDQLFVILHHIRPYRLGLVYCTQRRSDIVCLSGWKQKEAESLQTVLVSAADQELSILDMSVSDDGKRIAWLQCLAGGPHNRAFELWTAETNNLSSARPVTSVKKDPLYFDSQTVFSQNCWVNDHTVIIQTSRETKTGIYSIDTITGGVSLLEIPPAKSSDASYTLLDVARDKSILVLESSIGTGPAVVVGISPDGSNYSFRRFSPFEVDETFLESSIVWSLNKTEWSNYDCEYIIVKPKKASSSLLPLIVIPHGGPHSAFTTNFSEIAGDLALTGFAVIMINYPGSLGFSSLEDLPGKIGFLDLEPMQFCVTECLEKNTDFDKNNVFMFGGSHGGFLALRAIAAYPAFYRACVARNPVCDLAQMVGVSDIPDWVFVECGLQPSLRGFINMQDITKPEVLAKMNEQSPARFVDKVICPLMMCLGKNDRRVPMSQGLNYCRMLRQVNPTLPVEIFVYDDDHALNTVKVHSDVFVNVVQWFDKHRK